MVQLTAQERCYVRRRARIHALDPAESGGELNIVPFLDIVVNIIMFLLATTQALMMLGQIDASLPSLGYPVNRSSEQLSATITQRGIFLSSSRGKFLPGCETVGQGTAPSVGLLNGEYDWQGLSACAARIHARPEFRSETDVTMSADPNVSYQALVHAMDAIRHRGGESMFPEVTLSAGVR